jgi:hypothetical protein
LGINSWIGSVNCSFTSESNAENLRNTNHTLLPTVNRTQASIKRTSELSEMDKLVCKTLKQWQDLGRSFDRDLEFEEQKSEHEEKGE